MTVHVYTEITHWPVTGSNGFGGFTFGPAVLLEGRWENKIVRYTSAGGEELISSAIAYVPVDVGVGDYLVEGDETLEADPTSVDGSYRVEMFHSVTDLRASDTIRKAMM